MKSTSRNIAEAEAEAEVEVEAGKGVSWRSLSRNRVRLGRRGSERDASASSIEMSNVLASDEVEEGLEG